MACLDDIFACRPCDDHHGPKAICYIITDIFRQNSIAKSIVWLPTEVSRPENEMPSVVLNEFKRTHLLESVLRISGLTPYGTAVVIL